MYFQNLRAVAASRQPVASMQIQHRGSSQVVASLSDLLVVDPRLSCFQLSQLRSRRNDQAKL